MKPIKVAFDMDGVLLYNPTRIFRSLIAKSKQAHLFPREEMEFYCPKTNWEQFLWLLVHKSSFKPSSGYQTLKELVKEGKIEAYIVSARFACLKSDTERWLKKLEADKIFKATYFNDQNEQPHLFKWRMARELNVDYFVEDNWDVLRYLANQFTKEKVKQRKALWVSNKLDGSIDYPHKFFSFKAVMNYLYKICYSGGNDFCP